MARCRGTDHNDDRDELKQHANEKEVGQITHNSFIDAENSCDRFRLRVKSEPLIGSSIDVGTWQSSRHRSNTELTTDSHSRRVNAEDHAPKQNETPMSWGTVPAAKPTLSCNKPFLLVVPLPNAGPVPAFFLRARSVSSAPCAPCRIHQRQRSVRCTFRAQLGYADQTHFWGCRGDRASACADE